MKAKMGKQIHQQNCFVMRNSLIRDPYHYMIEFTGNYDMSSENIDTSSNSYNAFTDEVISMK